MMAPMSVRRRSQLTATLLGSFAAMALACSGGGGGSSSGAGTDSGTESDSGSGSSSTTGTASDTANTDTASGSSTTTTTSATTTDSGSGTTTTATATATTGGTGSTSGGSGSSDTGTSSASGGSSGGGVCEGGTDVDMDGHGVGCALGPDCDDANPNVWVSCATCVDQDGDTWWTGCDAYDTIFGEDCIDDPNQENAADIQKDEVEICDGENNDCDPQVDEAPIGDMCPLAEADQATAQMCDGANGCKVSSCEMFSADIDGTWNNGCECKDTTTNNTCATAVEVPQGVNEIAATPANGAWNQVNGRVLTTAANDVDVWHVKFAAPSNQLSRPDYGTLRIRLADQNGRIRFNVSRSENNCTADTHDGSCTATGGSNVAVATGVTEWKFFDSCPCDPNNLPGCGVNAADCTAHSEGWPEDLWVEVYATDPATDCTEYTLEAKWDE